MAGIFDTLAQVRMGTPDAGADWAKQVEAANARAAAIKAARGVAPVAAAPTGALYGAGKWLGRMAGRFGPVAGLGAMGFGMADQAAAIQADPESKGMGERTLQVLSGADVTGIGARIGRWATGRPEPTDTPVVPTVAPVAPVAGPSPRGFQADARRVDNALMPTQTTSPFTPTLTSMGAEEIRGTGVPVSGTGAMVNNTTGRVVQFDDRGQPGFGATPQMVDASTYDQMRGGGTRRADFGLPDRTVQHSWMGDATGAKLNINRATGEARQAREYAKIGADIALRRGTIAATREGHMLTAGSAANRLNAELPGLGATAGLKAAEATAMAERLRLAGLEPDSAKRAALIGGHAVSAPTFSVVDTAMPDPKTGAVPVLQRSGPGAGTIRTTVPQAPIRTSTLANAIADAKRNNKYSSPEQVRRDAEKLGVKITD